MMKYICLIFFLLFCSCGAPYCKKYPFEEKDDYKSWMVYSEGDIRYFQSETSTDTMEVWKRDEKVPKNTCPLWLENSLWFQDIHEYHAGAGYTFTIHHRGHNLIGHMSIIKGEMGEYAHFSFTIDGIYGPNTPVNQMEQDTINGAVFNDCIKIISNADEFPDRFVYPVEMTSACWSKSKGLLYYEIEGVKYYLTQVARVKINENLSQELPLQKSCEN